MHTHKLVLVIPVKMNDVNLTVFLLFTLFMLFYVHFQITVEETDIDFDVIQFNETYIRDFTVANNCHLPVHFEFSGKDGIGSKICEPWLHVEPTQGELITGDTLSIRIKVFIDVHTAWRIHRKQKVSNRKIPLDILVLHVDKGRDIFITIMGEYRPSCFGFSIDTLAKIPHPVYEMDLKDLMKIVRFGLLFSISGNQLQLTGNDMLLFLTGKRS